MPFIFKELTLFSWISSNNPCNPCVLWGASFRSLKLQFCFVMVRWHKSVQIFHHPMWTCKTVVLQLSPKFMFTEFRASFLHTALGKRHAIYSKKCPTVPGTLRLSALISHFTWAPVRWCRWIWACPSINISLTFSHPLSSLAPSCLSFSQVSCVVRWGEEPVSWGVLIHPSPLTHREQIEAESSLSQLVLVTLFRLGNLCEYLLPYLH